MPNFNLSATLSQKFTALNQEIEKIVPPIDKSAIQLSKIEYTVLFLLILGKSSLKEIAEIITKLEDKPLSESFVLYVIYDNLYRKFKVNSISELIEKATMMTHSIHSFSAKSSSAFKVVESSDLTT